MRPALESSSSTEGIAENFNLLRRELDRYVIGHESLKEALILGLIAREHIYIEGPPGIAKTMLAELVSASANLDFYFYQFHRDTRLAELIGDMVIQRERDGENTELIVQSIRKGGVLTAELCVLDDISRSPGEALNVLLRILNERRFMNESIPLLTAIATSNPTADDYYNEPLDPANLDRFTIQIRSDGLIQENQWDKVKAVIDLYADTQFSDRIEPEPILNREIFDTAYRELHRVRVPEAVKRGLIDLLNRLVNQYKLDNTNSLITDRAFLVKGIKVMKAKALLEGRNTVVPEDLHILAFMTTFRVPEEIHLNMGDLIVETLRRIGE
ncbi:MAG: MoxR family ATPase [SAR324 cluster bacterium]|nr:MoxR family ATPase [SAR324 cluster bacterium]